MHNSTGLAIKCNGCSREHHTLSPFTNWFVYGDRLLKWNSRRINEILSPFIPSSLVKFPTPTNNCSVRKSCNFPTTKRLRSQGDWVQLLAVPQTSDTGFFTTFHSNHENDVSFLWCWMYFTYFSFKLFGAKSAAKYAFLLLVQHSHDASWDLTKTQVISSYQGFFLCKNLVLGKTLFPSTQNSTCTFANHQCAKRKSSNT